MKLRNLVFLVALILVSSFAHAAIVCPNDQTCGGTDANGNKCTHVACEGCVTHPSGSQTCWDCKMCVVGINREQHLVLKESGALDRHFEQRLVVGVPIEVRLDIQATSHVTLTETIDDVVTETRFAFGSAKRWIFWLHDLDTPAPVASLVVLRDHKRPTVVRLENAFAKYALTRDISEAAGGVTAELLANGIGDAESEAALRALLRKLLREAFDPALR